MRYDKSSKWLIQHYGGSALRLAGIGNVAAWRALQAEVIQPRQLPDGLLEVDFVGEPDPDLFILELATYPEQRVEEQLLGDVLLVYLDRRVLPEVLTLVLHPKGNYRVPSQRNLQSRHGLTELNVRWRVVELWTLPAEELLRLNDVGLVPWIPLTQYSGPPEPVLQQCREIIDRQAPPDERANLLAVSQVLCGLRYNDPRLLEIFGGRQAMIESPVLREFLAHSAHDMILFALREKFGTVPDDLTNAVQRITDEQQLKELNAAAATCPDLDTFRARLGE